MEGNNKGNQVLLIVIGIATLLMAVVGATFAYFTATATSQGEQQTVNIKTATLGITYVNGTGFNLENTTLTADYNVYIPFSVENATYDGENRTASTVATRWKVELKPTALEVGETAIAKYANLTDQTVCATLSAGCVDVSDDFTYEIYEISAIPEADDNNQAGWDAELAGKTAMNVTTPISDTVLTKGTLAGLAVGSHNPIVGQVEILPGEKKSYVVVIHFNYLTDAEEGFLGARTTNLQNYQQGKSFRGHIEVSVDGTYAGAN